MTDRLDLKRGLHALAFSQAGYFSAAQALAVGYSHQAQKYHVDRGNWTRVDRGLFRIADWPPSASDVFARWNAWANGQGVLSHETAASIQGVPGFDGGPVHITLPHASQARPVGAVLHKGSLPEADIEDLGAYRATTLLRTLVDLADSGIPGDRLVSIVETLLDRAFLPESLRRAADACSVQAALAVERALSQAREP